MFISSIAEAYNNELNNLNLIPKYDVQYFRNLASNQITKKNFKLILENYKLEKMNNEFNGNWDPYTIKTIEQLKNEIKLCGNNFWGEIIY